MANVSRRCTECGTEIPEGSRAKTCSDRCRSRKARRIQRGRSRAAGTAPGGDRPENEIYAPEQHEIAAKVMAQELAPYIREQISDDVVQAIGGMMNLTPKVIAVLEHDLMHNDPQIRMKAAALVTKYSLPEKFMPGDVGGDNKVEVQVNVPTPDNYGAAEREPRAALTEGGSVLRECNRCGEPQPESSFDAGAPRCNTCQAELRATLTP